ncbi:MAG: ATP-binding cassette domain-containing protein [Candidatus Lokiarchaeota archaeon]|nr:ATP-binding cassette domain-containing protein [Candidatus Lokiarchaeota archaeon]
MEYVIETSGLDKSYGEVHALKKLDLRVPKNSIFAFLGPNGAGKTTAISLLLGLRRPTAGSGKVFGMDIETQNDEIRKRIGYLAQKPNFYKEMSARQTLEFASRFFYTGPKELIAERVSELLELVNLTEKADRPVEGFSGGETQRLGIAQALVNDPELLIFDEPAAGLDPQGRESVLKIMESLRDRATIFYSTHILDDVQRVSDEVAILNKGQLIAQSPIEELLAGSEGTVYSMTLEGSTDSIKSKVSNLDWVTEIHEHTQQGKTHWTVAVSDEEQAKTQLLRTILTDKKVNVTKFGMKQYELEEIFMRVVEEEENNE